MPKRKARKIRTVAKAVPAPTAPPPAELPPVVRRGDVAAQLLHELGRMFAELQRFERITARLESYKRLHPERHEHVRRFVEDLVDAP